MSIKLHTVVVASVTKDRYLISSAYGHKQDFFNTILDPDADALFGTHLIPTLDNFKKVMEQQFKATCLIPPTYRYTDSRNGRILNTIYLIDCNNLKFPEEHEEID